MNGGGGSLWLSCHFSRTPKCGKRYGSGRDKQRDLGLCDQPLLRLLGGEGLGNVMWTRAGPSECRSLPFRKAHRFFLSPCAHPAFPPPLSPPLCLPFCQALRSGQAPHLSGSLGSQPGAASDTQRASKPEKRQPCPYPGDWTSSLHVLTTLERLS